MNARSRIESRLFRGPVGKPLRAIPIGHKSDFYRLLKDRLRNGYERVIALPIDRNSPRISNAGCGDSEFDAHDAGNTFAELIGACLKDAINIAVICPAQCVPLYATARGDGAIGVAIVDMLRQHRDMLALSSKRFVGRGCYI